MYKIDVLKNRLKYGMRAARKLDIDIDISYNKSKNCFILCNGEGTTEFNINDCYEMLGIFNEMFNICVSGIETENKEQDIYCIGKLGN